MVLDKTLESPLDCKEIKPVNPKGNQSWIFIGRIDAEAENPIFWSLDVKERPWCWEKSLMKRLIWKDPDVGKDWRPEEKGMTEGEMVGWHYWLNGHEFEQTPGVGDGQGKLGCCSPQGREELDVTEQLKWTEAELKHQSTMSSLDHKELATENALLWDHLGTQPSPTTWPLCEPELMAKTRSN